MYIFFYCISINKKYASQAENVTDWTFKQKCKSQQLLIIN